MPVYTPRRQSRLAPKPKSQWRMRLRRQIFCRARAISWKVRLTVWRRRWQTNAAYTAQSTAIQESQAQRQLYMTLGTAAAAAGGSGSSGGGSAADIIRNSAQQGALNQSVIAQQGLITEAGYTEQANAYTLQQQAAGVAAQAQQASAAGETQAAGDYQKEANLFGESATGDFFSAALSGVAGVAQLFMGTTGMARRRRR